eukprot:8364913-Pyramimonas_sp.AAC.1
MGPMDPSSGSTAILQDPPRFLRMLKASLGSPEIPQALRILPGIRKASSGLIRTLQDSPRFFRTPQDPPGFLRILPEAPGSSGSHRNPWDPNEFFRIPLRVSQDSAGHFRNPPDILGHFRVP